MHNLTNIKENINIMFVIFLRSIILYFVLLIAIRLMGKRQIGEMQPFEFVITLIIANLGTIPMEDISKPFIYGLISVFSIVIVHHFVVLLVKNSIKARDILEGRPTIVITPDGINFKELKKQGLNISDLIACIRGAGYFSFEDIDYGIYETNGTFSVLPKDNSQSSTSSSSSSSSSSAINNMTSSSSSSLPIVLVECGKLNPKSIKMFNISEEWILNTLRQLNETSLKNVLVYTLDDMGNVYIQLKGKKYITLQVEYKGSTNI